MSIFPAVSSAPQRNNQLLKTKKPTNIPNLYLGINFKYIFPKEFLLGRAGLSYQGENSPPCLLLQRFLSPPLPGLFSSKDFSYKGKKNKKDVSTDWLIMLLSSSGNTLSSVKDRCPLQRNIPFLFPFSLFSLCTSSSSSGKASALS